jgi:aspartyl protease family protein
MSNDDIARVLYLSLLLMAVAGSLFAGLRQRPGTTVQQILIWGFIFLGLVAAYGLWPDLRRALMPREAALVGGALELRAAGDGHFYADALVNGQAVTFLIDTGASDIVLAPADARRAGIEPDRLGYTGQAMTANGPVATATIRLDSLALGPYEDRGLAASVTAGDLDQSLLGMSYLGRYEMTVTGDRLRLRR